ncbi:8515_t:CDS:2 [Cetraspora pellucida]|uniref:8515_t:CDS:1 n=1 Tax=Cetraspora pellucida TaxID=1433469 RepID=A0A9N9P298_9GLOM|nr:8515_t:CDS:2 [Cetraspora pellucida]
MENFPVIPNGSTFSTSIPNNNEAVVTSSTLMPNNNKAVVTSSTLTPNNNEAVVTSSTLTSNNNKAVVIGNTYNTRENWIEITGSWVSDNWRIVNIVLSFQKLEQTVKEITSVIMSTLKNYSIENKILALTMNNTATNKAVSRLLQNELSDKELISIGFERISILHKKVYKIMKFLANPLASNRLEVLESYCRISGIRFLKPILEINTRWNFMLAMFERYLYLHLAIQEMSFKEPSIPTCLDDESLTVLKSFRQLLKPFEIAISLDHLKATLIEVSGYNDCDAEIVVNDIHKKLITYRAKYSSTNTIEFELELYESELPEDLDDSNEIEKNNKIKL